MIRHFQNSVSLPGIPLRIKGRGGPRGKETEMVVEGTITDIERIKHVLSDRPLRLPVRPERAKKRQE